MKKQKAKRYNQKNRAEEFLSYEELPLENYEKDVPKISKFPVKRLIAAAVIILLCFGIVFAFYNRDKLSPENIGNWFNYELLGKAQGEGYPSTISGTNLSAGNIDMIDNYLVYASNTSCVTLSSSAYQIANRQITYSQPVLKTSGNRMLVYALGEKSYMVNTINNQEHAGSLGGEIFCADINKNGETGFVTETDGYFCKFSYLNDLHKEKYTYSFSEYFINSVKINNAGNTAVLGGVSAKEAQGKMGLYVLDFYSDKPKKIFEYPSDVVLDIDFVTDNIAVVVAKNSLFFINTSNGEITQHSYNKLQLTAYNINQETGCTVLSLSRSGDGRNCDVLYYNQGGELVNTIKTDISVSSLSVYKDRIALLQNETATLYNKEGENLGAAQTGKDARAILLSGSNQAYVLGVSEIRTAEFK
ncbi:MAG: DUF5711 family protein [Oscillospiraceae bacterium]|jgi:hypothetical protein|nr:DUF5711 family protein [Oscillospiraceae bacterium]